MESPHRRTVLGALGAALTVGAAGCNTAEAPTPSQDDATNPMVQYDAGNTGYHPDATGPTGSLEDGWGFRVDDPAAFLTCQPAVVDGVAYAGVSTWGDVGPAAVYAIDAAEGEQQWRFATESSVDVTPAVEAEHVYVVADGALRALQHSDGTERWAYPLSGTGGDPTVLEDTVYVIDDEPAVHAVDVEGGTARWTATGGASVLGRTPAVADGRVIATVPDTEGHAIAFGAESGDERWRLPIDEPMGTPVATPDAVFVADESAQVHRISPTGEHRWTETTVDVELRNSIGATGPAVTDDSIYHCGENGRLAALDRSGERRWTVDLPIDPLGSPVVADGVVYVGGVPRPASDSEPDPAPLFGVRTDGEIVVAHGGPSAVGPPTVLDGTVYCGVLRATDDPQLDVAALY